VPAFTRHLFSYLADDEYGQLQRTLAGDPEAGAVMPGTGGFRKMRWADPRRGKGTRGGLRIIYYHFADEAQIWLMTLYGKNEVKDLTPAEQRSLRAALRAECEARRHRRSPARKRVR